MSKGVNIPLTISGLKDAKKELAELEQQLKDVDKRTTESKDLKTKYDQLAKSIDGVNQELKETEQLAGGGLKKFTNEVKNTEKATLTVKQQLRLLTDQMAEIGDVGSPEFQKLANEAGVLRDKMNNARAAIDSMAEDFPRLKLGAQALQAVGGAAQVAVGGVQALGVENENLMAAMQRLMAIQSALNGLQTISQQLGDESALGLAIRKVRMEGLGKSIKSLGASFKAFGASLLTNPIFLIVAVIAAIVTAVVTLKDKIGFLGVAFEAFSDYIGKAIQGLKNFLDMIGASNFALQGQLDLLNAVIEKQKEKAEDVARAFDRSIALAQAEGKEVRQLEIGKQKAIIETANQQLEYLKKVIKVKHLLGQLDEEEVKNMKKALKESIIARDDAEHQIKIIEANATKERIEKAKEEAEKKKEAYKNYVQYRKDAARLIEDLELNLMVEGREKQLRQNEITHQRLREDTLANENYTQEEKKKIVDFYNDIEAQSKLDILLNTNEKELEIRNEHEEKIKELSVLRTNFIESEASKRVARDKAHQEELLANVEYYSTGAVQSLNAVNNLANVISENRLRNVEEGSKKEEKIRKQMFARQKALSLAQAAIDGFKAITASLAQAPIAIGAVPNPVGIASLAFAITQTASSIAAIAAQTFDGGAKKPSASNPSLGGGGATSSSSSTPSFELFGQANEGNNVSAPQSQETTQMTVKAVVVESDITSTQNKINKIQKSAEL